MVKIPSTTVKHSLARSRSPFSYLSVKLNDSSYKQLVASRIGSQRLPFFIRGGKKSQSEKRLTKLFVRRAHRTKEAAITSTETMDRTSSPLFYTFFRVATPFVALKSRRRGKRIVSKIAPILPNRGERKSFIALSKSLHTEGAVTKHFGERFERELEVIASSKHSATRGQNPSTGAIVTGSSQIRDTRDNMHQQAYQARPLRWGRSMKKETV